MVHLNILMVNLRKHSQDLLREQLKKTKYLKNIIIILAPQLFMNIYLVIGIKEKRREGGKGRRERERIRAAACRQYPLPPSLSHLGALFCPTREKYLVWYLA